MLIAIPKQEYSVAGRVMLLNVLLLSTMLGAAPSKTTTIPAGLQAAIQATRNAVEPDGVGYKAINFQQHLELRFERAAASVRLAQGEVRLKLAGCGRGRHLTPPAAAVLTASGNRVEYRRGAMTEWYVNDPRGLEQGFTFAKSPAGTGPLAVALAVEGSLIPQLDSSGGVWLKVNGKAVLRYGGLKAWDASGHPLAASMEVSGNQIRLTVQDPAAVYPVTIDPWLQQAMLTAFDGFANDYFGGAVALSGDTALVGAWGAEAAYVYVRRGTSWTEWAKLVASDGRVGDRFGGSVALSGGTAIVGAYGKDTFTGAAYVYVRSGTRWTQQAKLTASDGVVNDSFGGAVALSGDTAIVGAYGKESDTGAAYVYVRSGTSWAPQAKLTASDGVSPDEFGSSVALSGDIAIVGASYRFFGTGGAAYVYARSGTAWTQQAELNGGYAFFFGISVALSGDTALVGASGNFDTGIGGTAYVFVRNGTVWTQQAQLPVFSPFSFFGRSVALSGDVALVGAPGDGAAYLYVRSGTTWTQQAELTPSDSYPNDDFGSSVALSGTTAVLGADGNSPFGSGGNVGAAYVYTSSANLTTSPSSGSPFTLLTLTGTGYSPNESILFSFTGAGTVSLGSATADSGGAFVVAEHLPQAPYGTGVIQATGQTSGSVGSAAFSVTPRLILSPNTGTVGSTIVAQGIGFGAGEKVRVYWNTPTQFLGTATADSLGSFYRNTGLAFSIPAGAPVGTNVVVGRGLVTHALGTGKVTVQ